jgi:glucose/mannose-6-phosphate isomerase
MWEATARRPEQLVEALEAWGGAAAPLPIPTAPGAYSGVVVVGSGESGLVATLVADLAAPVAPVPVATGHPDLLPAFVGPGTLVLALSWSGSSASTVASVARALESGATVLAVTGGGPLAALVEDGGGTVVAVPAAGRARADLATMAVPPLVALEQVGLLPGARARLGAAGAALGARRDGWVGARGTPKEIARRIGRTFPLVVGAGTAAVAARRWAMAVQRNAKSPAWWSDLGELGDGGIAGFGQHGDVTRQVLTLVLLRDGAEGPTVARRFEAVHDLLDEVVGDVIEIRAEGEDEVTRFFEHTLVGDLVSLHLAAHEGVDPGPLPAVDDVRRRVC